MATQPMPPSLMAILKSGSHGQPRPQPLGAGRQRHLTEQGGAERHRGLPGGMSGMPEEPTWSEMTVSVSAHASTIGSQ